jgi:hypothetical protein
VPLQLDLVEVVEQQQLLLVIIQNGTLYLHLSILQLNQVRIELQLSMSVEIMLL